MLDPPSQRTGERVMTSIELFLTKHLKPTRRKARLPGHKVRKFLGFSSRFPSFQMSP
jgi:hypothetical protein